MAEMGSSETQQLVDVEEALSRPVARGALRTWSCVVCAALLVAGAVVIATTPAALQHQQQHLSNVATVGRNIERFEQAIGLAQMIAPVRVKKAKGYVQRRNAPKKRSTLDIAPFLKKVKLPPFLDWRLAGVVTPVKNQGQCGNCWAHASIEGVESMYALWTKVADDMPPPLQVFSPQQVTSCAPVPKSVGGGCNSADISYAYDFLMGTTTEGLQVLLQEEVWPSALLTQDGAGRVTFTAPCAPQELTIDKNQIHEKGGVETYSQTLAMWYDNYTRGGFAKNPDSGIEFFFGPAALVVDYVTATPGCQSGVGDCSQWETLAQALTVFGPLPVAVNASYWDNDHVSSPSRGFVLSEKVCPSNGATDHVVQLVGFNNMGSNPYWILKNQWATTWGYQGYMYLEFGANTCNLASDSYIPLIPGMEKAVKDPPGRFRSLFLQATKGLQSYEDTVSKTAARQA